MIKRTKFSNRQWSFLVPRRQRKTCLQETRVHLHVQVKFSLPSRFDFCRSSQLPIFIITKSSRMLGYPEVIGSSNSLPRRRP